jgi:hypothetical protein
VVLLIGGTGAGKSTLSKFLRQDASLKVLKNKADDFVFADGEDQIGNENSILSKTLFPRVDKDELSGAKLVDCAGFEDTRHPMYDLLASFFTHKVFNTAQQTKLIVVESFERMRLSSDRTSFMRSVKQLAQLLQDNTAAFKDSIGLVATKAESTKSDKQLKKLVNAFLNETIESLRKKQAEILSRGESSAVKALERQILLVQFMAAAGKVAIFRRPNDLQSPWTLPSLSKNFKQIRDLIFNKTDYLNISSHQYQVSVAPETVVYIQNEQLGPVQGNLMRFFKKVSSALITDFDLQMCKISSQILTKELEKRMEFSQNYLEEFSQINASATLFDLLEAHAVDSSLVRAADLEIRKFVFLHKVVGSEMNRLETEIVKMFGLREVVHKHFEETVNFYSFAKFLVEQSNRYEVYLNSKLFQSDVTLQTYRKFISLLLSCGINSDLVYGAADLKPASHELQVLNRIRSEMMIADFAMEHDENLAVYSSRYILASQIKHPENIKGQLVIMATHKIILDVDLELTDAHLILMAPIVEVDGTSRTITMRGSNGVTNQFQADVGLDGSHGEPGRVSGDIYILALDVINAKSLQILSVGGDGADGQAGGNGINGQKSESPRVQYLRGSKNEINSLVEREGYKALWGSKQWNSDSSEIVFTFFYNSRTDYETLELSVINSEGSWEPTNGGDGGSGGAGAPPGVQGFILNNTETRIASINSTGRCGKVGKGGSAGATVPVCSKVDYLCSGKSKKSNILGFINLGGFNLSYECTQPKNRDCETLFPAAFDGAPGRYIDIDAQVLTLPMDMSPDEYVQVFLKIFAHENGRELKEFLEFLSTLQIHSNSSNFSDIVVIVVVLVFFWFHAR